MISCIAIDDAPLALKQIENYINQTPYLNFKGSFYNALEALDFLQYNQIDLMFVDISMPDITGIEFIKALVKPPKFIFITAHREFALEGFKVDAADYLLKPISYADFLKAVEKTKNRYFASLEKETEAQNNNYLFVKSGYKVVKVHLNNIIYIEAMGEYIKIHQENKNPIMTLMSLKKIGEYLLNNVDFMKVHRSYIINLKKIITVDKNRIAVAENTFVPISNQYKEKFQKFLDQNSLH